MTSQASANDRSPGVITLEQVISIPAEGKEAGRWRRLFTKEGIHPFDQIEWKLFDAKITKPNGEIVFEQRNVEFPDWWEQVNVNIVADKYFRIINGVKENSLKQVFIRVASVLRTWAEEQSYFNSSKDAQIYEDELLHALVHQYGAFNSPVWFNLGVPGRTQAASACFISGVEDTLDSIMDFQKSEIKIFAAGSGSGANFSNIRSSYERLSSGSHVCGPVGWMEALDKYAKAMKSGGSTRAAAKMNVLNIDHPDILETKDGRPGFITCKSTEEKRAHALIDVGYSASYDDPNSAYKWVSFQNANNSVSVSDDFMHSLEINGLWHTTERTTGKVAKTYKAADLWNAIAEAAWTCGDPGIQFTDTINDWHTTPKSGRINSSNPCSEFLHCDNTACNLCAINLTKFFDGRNLVFERLEHSIRIFVTAQNAIIAKAVYPTEEITNNSHALRPIGLNYGDLGSLLMKLGYAYDSDEGRATAAYMASFMTGLAYLFSAKLAARTKPFSEFEKNKYEMLHIMKKHRDADRDILNRWGLNKCPIGSDVPVKSAKIWSEVLDLGDRYGFANSQTTLQAPLGSISFLMGMSTTGIEPMFSLVQYKSLVGGGFTKLVNKSVKDTLINLCYSKEDSDEICQYMETNDHIEGAPKLRAEHLPIFDCAMPLGPSKRCISPMGHLKMMAAIQPLITCAQSKTVNLPETVSPKEIANLYLESWKLGIKCIALYRDGSKRSQPLSTKKNQDKKQEIVETYIPKRKSLPLDCDGSRHKFEIGDHKGFIMMNEYPDGSLGEVFFKYGKNGSTVGGLIDGFTKLLSIALQYGIPLDELIESFAFTKFEPSGITKNPKIRFTESLFDYLFKLLDWRYFDGKITKINKKYSEIPIKDDSEEAPHSNNSSTPDAPPCANCGAITRRNGTCSFCVNCGTSNGCSG